MTAKELQNELDALANPKDAQFLQRFFKTYDGGYAAGDKFIGLRVPVTRKVASKYKSLELSELEKLLESPIHEHRLAALIIMVTRAKKANEQQLKALFDLYVRRTDRVNNWDLVDISCHQIVGRYLLDKPRDLLYKLATSDNIWERRIAIISTARFMEAGQLSDTFAIAKQLHSDTHDLIHKAVGWMLREAGKRDETALKKFLDDYAHTMPRTELRYALERLSQKDKAHYMSLKSSSVKYKHNGQVQE